MDNETGKVEKKDEEGYAVYSEENYWKTGYNYMLYKNDSDKTLVVSHSYIGFKNGLLIQPKEEREDMIVSRTQFALKVAPGEYKGVFAKPYTGYSRGGSGNTPELVDEPEDLKAHHEKHHSRYGLSGHGVPAITDDPIDEA